MLRIQLLFSTIAIFVRIELLCNSIRRLPPKRAYGVAVLEDSPIRYNKALFESIVYSILGFGSSLMFTFSL